METGRNYPHIIGWKRKKSDWVKTYDPGRKRAETLPGEWVARTTDWTPQFWGLTKGSWTPLSGWKLSGNNGGLQETWTSPTRREWGEDTGWTVRREDSSRGCQVPRPREHSSPAHSTRQHGWDLGLQSLERKPVCGTQMDPGPRKECLLKQHTRSHPTTAHAHACWESSHNPTCPTVRLHSQAEAAEANSRYPRWGTKETRTWGCIWAKQGKQLEAQAVWERQLGPLSIADRSQESVLTSLPSTLHLPWGKIPAAGRGESFHLKGTEPTRARAWGLQLQL